MTARAPWAPMLALSLLTLPFFGHAQGRSGSVDLSLCLSPSGYKAIPLNKLITGHLYLPVRMNDSTGTFILDTGAGATVLEARRQGKYGLTTSDSPHKAVGAGGGNMDLKAATADSFVMGDHEVPAMQVMLMDLDHVNAAFRQYGLPEVDGVIGADILTKGTAVIDYVNMVLYLRP